MHKLAWLRRRGRLDAASTIVAVAIVVGVWSAACGLTLIRVAGLGAIVAIALGIRRHSRRDSPSSESLRAMIQLGMGLGLMTVTNGGLPLVGAGAPAPVTVAAVGTAYVLVASGLLNVVARRLPGREIDVLVEACLIGALVGLGVWTLAQGRAEQDQLVSGRLLHAAVVLAADTAVLVVVVRLVTRNHSRLATYRYLSLGFAYVTGAHALAALSTFAHVDSPAALITTLMVCGFGFVGLAALAPTADLLIDPLALEPHLLSLGHVTLVVAGLLMAPAILAMEAWQQQVVTPSSAATTVLIAGVLVAYVSALLVGRATSEHRSNHDLLTGLTNRAFFNDRLERALAHARRSDGRVGVMFIDLDDFKQVNDTFGHAAGDRLLVSVADRLVSSLREEDTAARQSGDEFAILLPHLNDEEDVIGIAGRILASMTDPVTISETRLRVGMSIGVAVSPIDGQTADELMASADAAMYRAKEAGGNTIEIYRPELATAAHERLRIETALHEAIDRGELVLHYQPVLDARTGRTVQCEALVRWNSAEAGLLLPGHFVPIAERSDLVVRLGEWVLEEACAQAMRWHEQGICDVGVSVNVSARQFRHRLADTVARALRSAGMPAHLLTLELTESAAVDNIELVASTLAELREMGVEVEIDDFGTGYSGLRYLAELPLSGLKIDRSFIHGITGREMSIVSATIAMAHNLDLHVVAEGIETEAQRDMVTLQGCDRLQGYLFSRPVPAREATARLAAEHRSTAIDA